MCGGALLWRQQIANFLCNVNLCRSNSRLKNQTCVAHTILRYTMYRNSNVTDTSNLVARNTMHSSFSIRGPIYTMHVIRACTYARTHVFVVVSARLGICEYIHMCIYIWCVTDARVDVFLVALASQLVLNAVYS